MTNPVGQVDYNCPRCSLTTEDKNGKIVYCPKCETLMIKVWGGRSASGYKDYKWRDK